MKVGTRLYLAVLPAAVGVLLVAALAYWGQYARQVPQALPLLAAVTVAASLALAWRNTRYVAQRVERLASDHASRGGGDPDELDTIERVVDRLGDALSVAREAGAEQRRAAATRETEYAVLLADASAAVSRRLDDVRLPLHILLDNHFGELNENQEELLGAARTAVEDAFAAVDRLREIALLDQGALSLRRDLLHPGDLLTSLLPVLRARGARAGVRVELDAAPALPRIRGDAVRLRNAFTMLLGHRVEHAPPGDLVRIAVEREPRVIAVRVTHAPLPAGSADELLARRLIEAHGGSVETSGGHTAVLLPLA